MSQLGQSRRFGDVRAGSASWLKAALEAIYRHFAFWASGLSGDLSLRQSVLTVLVFQGHEPLSFRRQIQITGTLPPSIRYSTPVMVAARGETRNAMRSATSFGLFGRPIGIPPIDCMSFIRAVW